MVGIYKITNPKGAIYIGSSKEIETRIKRYKKLQCKSQSKLYNSLLKYGVDNHKFEIIQECIIDKLYILENYFGTLYNVLDKKCGLNCYLPKIGELKIEFSKESLIKRSNAQKGKKASISAKINMSNAQKGRKHKDETKQKMSINNNKIKIILDLNTGVFYFGTKEAAIYNSINRHTLKNMLNGSKKNKTSLVYAL
jgi:group I intron endonuclease